MSAQHVAGAGQKRINTGQECCRGQVAVPQPLVPHRANRTRHAIGISDAAQHRRDHVAVLERGHERSAFGRMVTHPVEELGETPLRRIHTAAGLDRGQLLLVRHAGNEGRLVLRPVVAPEVVIIERHESLPDRDHGRARGVEREGLNGRARYLCLRQCAGRRRGERRHVRGVRLRGEIRIASVAVHRVLRDAPAKGSARAVDDRHAHALRAEVNAGYERHLFHACWR